MAAASAGHQVSFASSGQAYRGGKTGSRMRRELSGLWAIFRTAMGAGRVDAIVSATSPPLLVVVAGGGGEASWRAPLPLAFRHVSGAGHRPGRNPRRPPGPAFSAATRRAYRRAALRGRPRRGHGGPAESLRRSPPASSLPGSSSAPDELADRNCPAAPGSPGNPAKKPGSTPATSGAPMNGAPCSTRSACSKPPAPPGAWSSKGAARPGPPRGTTPARSASTRCDWRPYVPEDQLPASLLAADVLAVTQKPETRGLLWPSKLALVTSLPRPSSGLAPRTGPSPATLRPPIRRHFRARRRPWHCQLAYREPPPALSPAPRDPAALRNAGLAQWRRAPHARRQIARA